jgi:hypothetical protein
MVMMAGKRMTKVMAKEMNSGVHRTLTEWKVINTTGKENTEDIGGDLKQSRDYLADQFLGSANDDGPRKDGSV